MVALAIEEGVAWGSQVSGNGTWAAGVSWSLESATEDTATYRVRAVLKSDWGYEVHARYRIYGDFDGDKAASAFDTGQVQCDVAVPYGGTSWLVVGEAAVTVKRPASARRLWCSAEVAFTGGYDDGTSGAYTSTAVLAANRAPSVAATQAKGAAKADLAVSGLLAGAAATVQRKASGAADSSYADVYSGKSATAVDACGAGAWSWRARQVDAWGVTSAWSKAATASVVAPPAAPALTSAAQAPGTTHAVVSVSPNASGATLTVQRAPASGSAAWVDVYSGGATPSVTDPCGAGAWRYRARNTNAAGDSGYSPTASVTVVAAPGAPTVRAARAGGATIAVAVSSEGTSVAIQQQRSGSAEWVDVYSGPAVASKTFSPGTGTYRYRASASNVAGSSPWSAATDWVTPMAPPGAPTLKSPASGSVHATSGEVALSWAHNPTDGSAQTKAEVGTSVDGGGTWDTASYASESSCTRSFPSPCAVAWRVRTAGVSGEYGPWATSGFMVYRPPSVEVSVPATVEAVPFEVSWGQGDADGSVAGTSVEIVAADGATEWSASFGAGVTSCSVSASDFIPRNGARYTVRATVRSSHGLTGTGRADFVARYVAPGTPVLALSVDPVDASVTVTVGQEASDVATSYIVLSRDGLTLAPTAHEGTVVVDRTPALDREVAYRAVAVAESGAVAEGRAAVTVPSGGFVFFNFAQDCAKAGMNASLKSDTQVESTSTQAAGRELPVVAYGEHRSTSGTFSADVWWFEDAAGHGWAAGYGSWKRYEAHIGQSVMRAPLGETRDVSSKVSVSLDAKGYNRAKVSVKWTEVDGDGLAR